MNGTLTVAPLPPSVSASPTAQTIANGALYEPVTLTATDQDANGSALNIAGTLSYNGGAPQPIDPSMFVLQSTTPDGQLPGEAIWTINSDSYVAAGTYVATIVVTDNYESSSTTNFTVSVTNTATTVASSADPSVFGQAVTFTATVSSATPGTPTGTVTFMDGAVTLGTGMLDGNAQATLTTTALGLGSHNITAVYGGDSTFNGSTSAAITQAVNQAGSSATLSASTDSSIYGQSLMFTATVSAAIPASGTPTGAVTFWDGATDLGTATLSGGTATLTTSALLGGGDSITVSYGGDSNFQVSTSNPLTETVDPAHPHDKRQ